MQNEATAKTDRGTAGLVTAPKLRDAIWPAEECRPCIRSIRTWTASRILPSIRVGGLIYYDVAQVKKALAKRTVKSQ